MKIIFVILIFVILSNNLFSQELHRYTCLVDRVKTEQFQKANGRKFNDEGILISKGKYHPLAISQFGILSYYEFEGSGDSSYYYKCLNQAKYFMDSVKVHYLFDGKGIGLPYNFNFSDLKAPWYSGMTQGYAASFLLRYYQLTNDKEILPIIGKIIYVLKQPQNNGGTISVNKEGYKWIEEYPNSKKYPQVLNGAINGFIGLKEYCDFFPKDTSALSLLAELYEGLKATIPKYDLVNWSKYSRGSKRLSNLYMRYEINEMEHLYNIFNDDFFYHQMMIWSTFAYNKPNKNLMYKRGTFNYSIPAKKYDSIFWIPDLKLDAIVFDSLAENVINLNSRFKIKKYFRGKLLSFKKNESSYHILEFKESEKEVLFEIKFKSIPEEIKLLYFCEGKIKKADYEILYSDENKYILDIKNIESNIIYKTSEKRNFNDNIIDFKIIKFSKNKLPYFSHNISRIYKINEGSICYFSTKKKNIKRKVVFYKHSKTEQKLKKINWKVANSFSTDEFKISEEGFYKFMTVAELVNPFSMFSSLTKSNIEIIK